MKMTIILSLIALTILSSCAPSMNKIWTKENYSTKKFNKILVIGIAKDSTAGTTFENAVVSALKMKEINATNSLTIFSSTNTNKDLSEEQIQLNIDKGNYDGILVSWLVDIETRKISITGPEGYNSEVGNSRNYINNGYQYIRTTKDYIEEKSYILETKFFDNSVLNSNEALIWSGQYSITEPSSFYSGAKDYATTLVKTLFKSEIIK